MFSNDKEIKEMHEYFSGQLAALSAEYDKVIASKNEEIRRYQEMIGHYEQAFDIIRKITENQERISSNQDKILAENVNVIKSLKLLLEQHNE